MAFASGVVASNAQTGAVTCPPNIDFSASNFNNWTCYTGDNIINCGIHPCLTNVVNSGPISRYHAITSGSGTDLYGGFPVVAPGGGLYSMLINTPAGGIGGGGNNSQGARVSYRFHIPSGFNNYCLYYRYAQVVKWSNNYAINSYAGSSPALTVTARDSATGNFLPCAYFTHSATDSGYIRSTYDSNYYYRPWTDGTLNLSGFAGRTIYLEVTGNSYIYGGHPSWAYFDIIACGHFVPDISVCDMKSGNVTLKGPGGYKSYKWYDASWNYLGQGLQFSIPVPASPAYYYCVLSPYSNGGCADTIRSNTVGGFSISTSPKSFCNTMGRPVGIRTTLTGNSGGYTFSWLGDASLTPQNPGVIYKYDSATARPTTSNRYLITVADSNGCFIKDTVTVLEAPYKVNAGPDKTTCLGTNVQLSASVTPVSNGYNYLWTPGRQLNDSMIATPVYTPLSTGIDTLYLRVDYQGCAAGDTIVIRTLPNSFIVSDTAVCQGAKFNANVIGDTAFRYVWSPTDPFITVNNASNTTSKSPLIQGDTTKTYTVKAQYPTCPDIVRTLTVRVEPVPRISLSAAIADKCFEQPLRLAANVQPAWFSSYSYIWRPNAFIDNPASPLINFSGQKDTTLLVTVRTPIGCSASDSVRVRVYKALDSKVTPGDTVVCPGSIVRMQASGGIKYHWTPSRYLSDTSGPVVIARPAIATDYFVWITDKNGCTDTLPVKVQVGAEAKVEMPDSVVLYPGDTYQMAPLTNGLYFLWSPVTSLSNAFVANPTANPGTNTVYYLKATTEAGCVITDSIHVIVADDALLELPNAFSPGSSPNTLFSIIHRGTVSLKSFRIFNRWGTVMFETSNINQGWDGRYNGEPQPMGVYIYTVEAITIRGNTIRKAGNVTLLR